VARRENLLSAPWICDDGELQLHALAWHQGTDQLTVQEQLSGRIFDLILAPAAACRFQIGNDQFVVGFYEQIDSPNRSGQPGTIVPRNSSSTPMIWPAGCERALTWKPAASDRQASRACSSHPCQRSPGLGQRSARRPRTRPRAYRGPKPVHQPTALGNETRRPVNCATKIKLAEMAFSGRPATYLK